MKRLGSLAPGDNALRRSALNSINLAKGAMIRGGTSSKSCERQFTGLVKATAELKAASVLIAQMGRGTPERFNLERQHAIALKGVRTAMSRFKDRCFV